MAGILNQLFAGGRLRGAAGTPAGPPAVPTPAVAPAGPAGTTTTTERPPLVIAERRSNSIVVHGRRSEIETIRRILGQLDINVTGGRRVFIYFAENAKSKDLAATLNASTGPRRRWPRRRRPRPLSSGHRDSTATTTTAADHRPGRAHRRPGGPSRDRPREGSSGSIAPTRRPPLRHRPLTHAAAVGDVEPTIRQLDKMPRQVLIEVLVAEITLQDDTKLGVDWALKTGSFRFVSQSISTSTSGTPGVAPPTGLDGLGAATAIAGLPGAGLTAFAFATDKFFAMLNALASENRVNVVSNPHVMTSENKKAIVNVSASIPIVTSQQTGTLSSPATTGGTTSTVATTGSVNQTVEYRDAGVVLTVTPRIGERGTVALDVKQEVNDIGDPEPPTGSRRSTSARPDVGRAAEQSNARAGRPDPGRRGAADRGFPSSFASRSLAFLFGFKDRRSRAGA